MNEVVHRYLFERAVCKKRDNDATRFLEAEIVKEIYFLSVARDTTRDRASVVESGTGLVRRALRVIDENLFEADVVARLARAVGASKSTLLRASSARSARRRPRTSARGASTNRCSSSNRGASPSARSR